MPTSARIVAAILFAIIAYLVSQQIKPLMPPETNFGWFVEVNSAMGFLIGWIFVGKRAGDTYAGALGYGLTGAVLLIVWGLFIHSFWEMIERSLRKQYKGPMEAVVSVFDLMFQNAFLLINPGVIGTLLGASMLSALVIEWMGRRFE